MKRVDRHDDAVAGLALDAAHVHGDMQHADLADDTAPDSSDRFEEETARRSARIVKQAVGQL